MPALVPAFVLGVEHPRGVACVRSLARRGIPVVSVDHRLSSAAGHYTCRHIARRARIDPGAADAVDRLEQLAGPDGGVLIPTSDEYLIFAARNHHRLARTFAIACPDWAVLEPVMDRVRSTALARGAGVPTARVFQPTDARELADVLGQLDFSAHRYVLKLELWTDGAAETVLRRKTTYGGASRDELRERALEIAARTGEFPTIQELVPGTTDMSVGVTMVMSGQGKPVLSYCVRRLKLQTYSQVDDFRHPYDLGGNVFCETVHDPEAAHLAEALARAAGWRGVITVEFRRDPRDGALKFVKFDPRVIRSTSLSTAIGMDVPSAMYDVALDRTPSAVARDYADGVCWIWLDNLLESLWRNRRQRSVRRELIGLLRRVRAVRAFAYWDRRDPLPALTQVAMRLTLGRRWVHPKRLVELTGFRTASSPPAPAAITKPSRRAAVD